MSRKAEEIVNLELILNILGIEFLKQKRRLNTPDVKDNIPDFFFKE